MEKLKFYIALQGNKSPKEYIHLAKFIENLGFDRIYVYDDLMYYSSTQILTLIAEHTDRIEIGPCLLNGVYRHPAIIAQEAAFLDTMAPGRTVLGIGRGAFFDFYNLNDSERHTRKLAQETLLQVQRLLKKEHQALKGKYFSATEKAFLRMEPENTIPTVIGSWSENMATVAAQHASELQIANVWNTEYLQKLHNSFSIGTPKKFSIGGMACISYNKEEAYKTAKNTIAVYIPYLSRLLTNQGFNTRNKYFKELFQYSKQGQYEKCAKLLTNEVVDSISLVGTPETVTEKIEKLHRQFSVEAIMISPPYGSGTFEENLELIKQKVIDVLNK
jgi:alkanesulfonate monooxygenase SsuD/methylene tetrahydromethanopterin reductase-like flavin-dependent oxidoreductase (luciferase family)